MTSKWQNEKEKLIDLIINQNKSYEEVGRMYKCSGNNIKKVMKKTLNIIVPTRRKINSKETFGKRNVQKLCAYCKKPILQTKKFCDRKCMGLYNHNIKYQKILDGDSAIMRANYTPKAFRNNILEEQGNTCAICGISPIWNGKPIIFIIDHIDGHASNNHRSNLRCICPNCDSQLDTYKSKNKNGDRYYYRYRYFRSAPEETLDVELS